MGSDGQPPVASGGTRGTFSWQARVKSFRYALVIGLVWAMEALNTAIELLADEVSVEHRLRLGRAKDVAAFGVLAAAIAAVLIGLFVFIPHGFR